jgi:hypothetical protein
METKMSDQRAQRDAGLNDRGTLAEKIRRAMACSPVFLMAYSTVDFQRESQLHSLGRREGCATKTYTLKAFGGGKAHGVVEFEKIDGERQVEFI